jgi:hypothetical protein
VVKVEVCVGDKFTAGVMDGVSVIVSSGWVGEHEPRNAEKTNEMTIKYFLTVDSQDS